MNPPKLPQFLLPCIALVAILSLVAVADRHRVETRNRSVSICAEYETVESLAASQGISVDTALKSLYRNGLRSVVLTEETAGELIAEGRLSVRYAAKPGGETGAAPIVSGAPDDMKRLLRGNSIRYGAFSDPVQVGEADEQFPKLTPGMLRALPLGIDPDAAKRVRDVADFFHDQKDFQIIARMGNPVGISPKGVTETIGWAAEQGAKVYCPIGDQVLGRRDGKNSLIDALKSHDMLYASPEFAKIGGDEQILQAAPELIVRLHAAQAAELDKLPPAEAVDRYARAARERNMRILLLRPIDYAAAEPLYKFSEDFVKAVSDAIRHQGAEDGAAHAFTNPKLGRMFFFLMGLSLLPILWWAGTALNKNLGWAALVVGLGAAALCHSQHEHNRQYAALLAAVTFPIVGYFVLDALKSRSPALGYVLVTLISLTGGLFVAGLLSALPYYIRAEEFPGVKLAVFFPILFVAGYFAFRLTQVKSTLKSPILWGAALLGLVVLGALAFMLMRTGNDNPAAVSSTELQFRDILDKILFVRPRTKTFLIGFPLLYIGVAMLMRYRNIAEALKPDVRARLGGWTALALAGGAIGQTDIVNTLCHIHTPVALSIERIGVAFIAGTVLGALAWFVISRWLPNGKEQVPA